MTEKHDKRIGRNDLLRIPVDMIEIVDQNYASSDRGDLEALAASIKKEGILVPLRCWRDKEGKYALISGYRRMAAVRLINARSKEKIERVPVILDDRHANDGDRSVRQLLENAHREDATPIERAKAYRRLIEVCGLTMAEICERLGERQENIKRYLELLQASTPVRKAVDAGKISASAAAKIVSRHRDDAEGQKEALEAAMKASGPSGRATVRGTSRVTKRRPRMSVRTVQETLEAQHKVNAIIGKVGETSLEGISWKLVAGTIEWFLHGEKAPWDNNVTKEGEQQAIIQNDEGSS